MESLKDTFEKMDIKKVEKETYHYDNWWDFTLEERNKHRKETIKTYEKELNEMKNKIRKKNTIWKTICCR